MAIVLAEIQASAADIHVPLEGSFAASSSVRHWAGFEPRHVADAPLGARGAIPVLVVQKFLLKDAGEFQKTLAALPCFVGTFPDVVGEVDPLSGTSSDPRLGSCVIDTIGWRQLLSSWYRPMGSLQLHEL